MRYFEEVILLLRAQEEQLAETQLQGAELRSMGAGLHWGGNTMCIVIDIDPNVITH